MNWVAIGVIAEVVAAIGVVVSLLFVAYQLRSNTHALRSAEYQALHDTEDGFYSDIMSNPSLARIWKLGVQGVSNLSEDERAQWEVMALRFIYLIQMVHYQHRKAMVDDEFWEAWETAWIEVVSTNVGVSEIYHQNLSVMTRPFREYTEQCKGKYSGGKTSILAGGRDSRVP